MVELAISWVKRAVKQLFAACYYISQRYKTANNGKVIILMYHRVLQDTDPYIAFIQPGMYVRQSSFKKQMEFLKEHYTVLSMAEFLAMTEEKTLEANKQYCVITFDDGWLDNYQYAFPILQQLSLPATIFLAEAFINSNRLFWHEKISFLFFIANKKQESIQLEIATKQGRISNTKIVSILTSQLHAGHNQASLDNVIEALKSFPSIEIEQSIDELASELNISLTDQRFMLNWQEVKEMGDSNIHFASHTCEHQILTNIPIEAAEKEITESGKKLEAQQLNYLPVFCYPNGHYNEAVKQQVIKSGYKAAFSTRLGKESQMVEDLFAIKRIGIHDDTTHNNSLFAYRLR